MKVILLVGQEASGHGWKEAEGWVSRRGQRPGLAFEIQGCLTSAFIRTCSRGAMLLPPWEPRCVGTSVCGGGMFVSCRLWLGPGSGPGTESARPSVTGPSQVSKSHVDPCLYPF